MPIDLKNTRILLSNDDGVGAEGLQVLERVARSLSDDVWVVAPDTERSGAGHSLSLHEPLRYKQLGPNRFHVAGTPTDAVLVGVMELVKDKKPGLMLSGINRGSNLAEDVTYSGTIAAAIEGTLLGVPSIALSQSYGGLEGREKPVWDSAEAFAPKVIGKILETGIPPGVLANVNFPSCTAAEVQGVAVTAQGRRDAELMRIEERRDGRNIPYYWLMFQRGGFTPGEGTDLEALADRKVSVTPLRIDLTDEAERRRYTAAFAAG